MKMPLVVLTPNRSVSQATVAELATVTDLPSQPSAPAQVELPAYLDRHRAPSRRTALRDDTLGHPVSDRFCGKRGKRHSQVGVYVAGWLRALAGRVPWLDESGRLRAPPGT